MEKEAEKYFNDIGIPCDSYLTRKIVINMLVDFANQQIRKIKLPSHIQEALNSGDGVYRP